MRLLLAGRGFQPPAVALHLHLHFSQQALSHTRPVQVRGGVHGRCGCLATHAGRCERRRRTWRCSSSVSIVTAHPADVLHPLPLCTTTQKALPTLAYSPECPLNHCLGCTSSCELIAHTPAQRQRGLYPGQQTQQMSGAALVLVQRPPSEALSSAWRPPFEAPEHRGCSMARPVYP
jgi:hypothetical protein